MDPLRVKWWGPKHLGPSYICELSLHPKFRSPSITPSHKKAGAAERKNRERKKERKKTTILMATQYPLTTCVGTKCFPATTSVGKRRTLVPKIFRSSSYLSEAIFIFFVLDHLHFLGEVKERCCGSAWKQATVAIYFQLHKQLKEVEIHKVTK